MPIMTVGQAMEYYKKLSPEKKQRTMERNVSLSFNSKVEIRTCRKRETMARTIRQEQRKPHSNLHWRPLVKLNDAEGFY